MGGLDSQLDINYLQKCLNYLYFLIILYKSSAMSKPTLLNLWLFGFSILQGCSVAIEVQAREEIPFRVNLSKVTSFRKLAQKFPNGKLPSDYKLTLPFWYSTNYSFEKNKDLQKYKSKIRGLRLRQFSYRVTENTLSVDLPSHQQVLSVYVGDHGKTNYQDFTKIGFFYPIPSSRINISDRLQLNDKGESAATAYFKKLSFAIGLQGNLTLNGSQDPTIPSGSIVLKVIVDVLFVVDVDL